MDEKLENNSAIINKWKLVNNKNFKIRFKLIK